MEIGAVIQRNHRSVCKATHAVLKQAHLCIADAGGCFEQQAA
jgi:hypothetical protein